MIRKKTFAVVLGVIMFRLMYGQDYHFSGFMQNMAYVNPAYAALPDVGEIGLTWRNQWPGIPATFVTYGAEFVMPVQSLSSGIGVVITNDMQGGGIINRTSAGIIYGYKIELDRDWEVGAGLSASMVMKKFNTDNLVFRSDLLNDLGYNYGTVVWDNYNINYPDFSLGFIARHNILSFGVSASHLTRPRDTESNLPDSRLPLKYTLFASGILGADQNYSNLSIEPSVFYSLQKTNQELIWGAMLNYSSKVRFGAWLRQRPDFNLDALIVTAGISWEKYNINYSYDVNLKKISFLSTKMAAHEVTFLYRFEYKDRHKVKRFRKSECPAY